MATVTDFYLGARPKTLTAAISPVLIGSSLAIANNNYSWDLIIGCLIVGIALQVGVNYANDYSDGIKGTDKDRVGPMRLVGSGRATPKSVFIAMLGSFFVAGLAGIYVSLQSSPYLILVGAICIALAYFYTGTKFAYGYYGLGELAVFICFGLIATAGTYFVNTQEVKWYVLVASFIPGLFSVAILLANNIRDIQTDIVANKRTLAARLGKERAVALYKVFVWLIPLAAFLVGFEFKLVFFGAVLGILSFVLSSKISQAQNPKQYIDILVLTSKANLAAGIFISALVILS